MALTFVTSLRNTRADAITAAIDAGSAAGKLRIYSGTRPADPGTAPGGGNTLLAEFALSDPSFGAAASGVITLDVTPAVQDTSADATGTAAWFRIVDSDGNGKVDGSVTATGGGGDLTLNTTSITSGSVVSITAGTITEA